MSHPIHILKHEHRVIEQGLRALNGICLRLASGQWIPPGTLSQLLDFSENVGFSAFVSVGSMLDDGWGDLIYYLGDDPQTD